MRRVYYFPYLALLVFLCLMGFFPSSCTSKARSVASSSFSPFWRILAYEKIAAQGQNGSALVILRQPSFWNSTLWIDKGMRDNVVKDSPVLSGKCLVGLIEDVEFKRARVRLITDAHLVVSVRVARGNVHSFELLQHVESIEIALQTRPDLLSVKQGDFLKDLRTVLMKDEGTIYLAKGELHGSGAPLWRSKGHVLTGIGFNYDYTDDLGPQRDLRTGATSLRAGKEDRISLIQVGDLLVTTGLDGVFPPDVPVAIVSKVDLLSEGDVSYTIEAVPAAGSLEQLVAVDILPPHVK